MARVHDQAIVLRTWDFSETSQTAALFTREHGAVRGLAKGARRDRGSFSGGFEPLTRGEIGVVLKPAVELSTLTDWDMQEVFRAARSNLVAHHAGLYIADALHHAFHTPDPHPSLFDAALSALRQLADPANIGPTVLGFQWLLLREAGYEPRLGDPGKENGQGASTFSPHAGGVLDASDASRDLHRSKGWKVRPRTLESLRAVRDTGAPGTGATTQDVSRASRLLDAHLRSVLDVRLNTSELLFGPLPEGGEA